MTKQLYDEALADVKKLKEVAEDNAKKALIEAVAPRIKDLIEAELLREAGDASDEPETKDPMASDGLLLGASNDSDSEESQDSGSADEDLEQEYAVAAE